MFILFPLPFSPTVSIRSTQTLTPSSISLSSQWLSSSFHWVMLLWQGFRLSVPNCALREPAWWKCTRVVPEPEGEACRRWRGAVLPSKGSRTRLTAWSSGTKHREMKSGRGTWRQECQMLEPCCSRQSPRTCPPQKEAQAPLPTWWVRIYNSAQAPGDAYAHWSFRSTAFKNSF